MSAMMKKPECIFDGAGNKKDLKKEDNLFSVVAAKNYGRMVLPVPSEPKLSYKLSITLPAGRQGLKIFLSSLLI
jgi:hypothetical protein